MRDILGISQYLVSSVVAPGGINGDGAVNEGDYRE